MSNEKICSGCKEEHGTVDRDSFDGLCADCTTQALYDDDFRHEAVKYNNILKQDHG